jgi:hypothetical protein
MNAKVSANARTKAGEVLRVVGVAAALLVATSSAFAQSHGGGAGGGHGSGGHFSAPHAGVSHGFGGAHYATAPRFYGPSAHAQIHAGAAYGYGYGHAYNHAYSYGHAYGYGAHATAGYIYHPAWGGGYWHGGYWPAAYYGWGYPLYLGYLPAVYATYWWGGLPYYYVNNVYYNWNAADNGYVAVDPPPSAGGQGYSDDVNAAAAAGPDAGNAADNTPSDVAPPGAAAGLIAYPRNGQSDEQQSTDKFQCHTWAKGQTGFDPTSQSSSGATTGVRSAYARAMSACLDARGYTVR